MMSSDHAPMRQRALRQRMGTLGPWQHTMFETPALAPPIMLMLASSNSMHGHASGRAFMRVGLR